jgi:hypothetical protein
VKLSSACLGQRSFPELSQVGTDYIDEFICSPGPRRVLPHSGVENMKPDMTFDQFSHQSVQGTTTSGDLLEQISTLMLTSKRPFNCFNLSANPANAP